MKSDLIEAEILRGPYYCDNMGKMATVAGLAKPNFIPCIRADLKVTDLQTGMVERDVTVIYDSKEEIVYTHPILKPYEEIVIDKLLSVEIKIWKEPNDSGRVVFL